jgi:hypothetical protein
VIASIDQLDNQLPEQVCAAITEVLQLGPTTLRALFYHLVSRGVIAKGETEFSKLCGCFQVPR